MGKKKQKIPINTCSAGWSSPFEKLSAEGLPPGETTRIELRHAAPTQRLGRVVLRRETAQRGGKTVIVIHDFQPQVSNVRIEELAGKLKKACGCGGTVKGRAIEIQGNQPGRIRALLEAEGFQVAGMI